MRAIAEMTITVATVLALSLSAFAEGPAGEHSAERLGESAENQSSVTTDAIFDDIISSLPDEVRARVDSASGIHPRQQRQTARQGDEAAEASHPEVPVDKLDELPEKLRLQVEKTIQEMDTRNTQRRMELKEHRRRRSE